MHREFVRRAPASPAVLFVLLASLAGGACSGGDSETVAAASPGASAPAPASEPTLVRAAAAQRAPRRAEELADAYDQERDEWESEALAVGIERRLRELGLLLRATGEVDATDVAALASEGYEGGSLVPARLEDTKASSALRLRRWRADGGAADAERRGLDGLAQSVRELRDALALAGEGAEIGSQFQAIGVQRRDATIEARVLYSAWARAAGGAFQQEAVWLCRFAVVEGERDPRIAGIELAAYEDGRLAGRRAMYEDCTASVLGADPTFEPQVLRGLDHWLPRITQVVGMTNIGHHGFALGDVDGDGLEDLYVCDDGGLPNRLYRQQPDGTLRDISAEAGVDWLDHSSAPLLLDLDNDGDQDLVVAMRGLLLFAQNNGKGQFASRVRIPLGVGSMSISAADYDSDGDLDVYCCMYNAHAQSEGIAYPYNRAENGSENLFLRNAGGFRFVEATDETGFSANNTRFSFAAAWEDYDDDGDQDLYVANDFGHNNLYRNEAGHFTDVAPEAGVEDVASGMSAAWGDFDRNGHPDIYVGNLFSAAGLRITEHAPFAAGKSPETVNDVRRMARGNSLFSGVGDGSFRDVSVEAGVTRGRWAWASPFVDLDGDGWEDLVVANGYYTLEDPRDLDSFFWRHVVHRSPTATPNERELDEYMDWWLAMTNLVKRRRSYNGSERNAAFMNLRDGTFADVSALSGFDLPEDARSLAVTDWDFDGDLDLWVRNRTGPRLRLLSNQLGPEGGAGAFVAFHLQGTTANRDGIGARVEVELEGSRERPLRRSLQAGTGFLGQSSKWLHFGLEGGARIAAVRVRWPDGGVDTEEFAGAEAGKRYALVQGSGRAVEWKRPGGAVRIDPKPLPQLAEAHGAAVFLAARFPAPILRCVAEGDTEPSEIELGSSARLLLLWAPWSKPSVASVEALAHRADALRDARLEVLVIDASDVAEPRDAASIADAKDARALVESSDFPFRRGRATAELFDKLARLEEYLFDVIPPPCLPFGLLIDEEGQLCAIYRGGPEPELLLRHVAALAEPLERRYELAMPIPGRWKILATDVSPMTAANWFVERYPEDAERYYERAIAAGPGALATDAPSDGAVDPGRARALARLAELRLTEAKVDEAIALLRESIELDPSDAEAMRDLANAELFRGELEPAIEHFGAAIALDPRLAAAHAGLGSALKRSGRMEEALQAYRKALELDPGHPQLNDDLGRALFEQQDLDGAAACFERAIASDPKRGSSHYLLGAVRAARGEREASFALYRRGLELDATTIDVHFGRGEGYATAGRFQDAIDHFDLVLERRPTFAKAYLRRGQARARAGETALALEDGRRAAELATDPALREEAAKLLAELQ